MRTAGIKFPHLDMSERHGAQRTTGRRVCLSTGLASIGSGIGAAADARSAFLISLAGPTAVIRRATGSGSGVIGVEADGRVRRCLGHWSGLVDGVLAWPAGSSLGRFGLVADGRRGFPGFAVAFSMALAFDCAWRPVFDAGRRARRHRQARPRAVVTVFTPSFGEAGRQSEPAIVVKFEFGHDFLFRTGCRREGQDDR